MDLFYLWFEIKKKVYILIKTAKIELKNVDYNNNKNFYNSKITILFILL